MAPKRKGLDKQIPEWVKGWVNEKQNNSRVAVIKVYCHFQSMLETKKQCQQSYVNTICKSESLYTIFRFVRSSYQTQPTDVVKDMCDN